MTKTEAAILALGKTHETLTSWERIDLSERYWAAYLAEKHDVKWCGSCKTVQPRTTFVTNRWRQDGLTRTCGACRERLRVKYAARKHHAQGVVLSV